MSHAVVEGVRVDAICAMVPANEVDNLEVGRDLFGDALDNLVVATGVRKRRIVADPSTTALDLCVAAAEVLFDEGELDRADIGGLVFVTFTPEHIMPSNAMAAQHRLGLSRDIAAFDVNLACSGYPYGLWVAAMMARSTGKKVLLLDGDKQSHIVSPRDRATALLFSDAGTATVVSPDPSAPTWHFAFLSDGSQRDALIIRDGGSKNWLGGDSLAFQPVDDGGERRATDIAMDGLGVFKFVVTSVPSIVKELAESSGIAVSDLDHLVLHQANLYMLKQVGRMLRLDKAKIPITIDKYGNSSSATVPVTIVSELADALRDGPRKVMLAGFGAGLSIGVALVELGPCRCFGVREHAG